MQKGGRRRGIQKGRLLRPSGKAIETEMEIRVLPRGVVEAVASLDVLDARTSLPQQLRRAPRYQQ